VRNYHAPSSSERPDSDGVRDSSEGDTDDDEEEICERQTDDERVGRAAHLQVGNNNDDDWQVTDEAEDGDDGEHDRDDHAYDSLVR